MRPLGNVLLTLTFALLLGGCRGVTPQPDTTPATPAAAAAPAAPAAPADAAAEAPAAAPGPCDCCPHNDIRWSRESAEHKASLIQVYRLAGEVLAAMAADLEPGTWAVALDADETVIDNSLYQVERAAIGKSYDTESWAAWTARKEAPPLPGALGFLNQIHQLGGKIAIVTNRRQPLCADTEANFRDYSIPYDVILCRRDDRRKEGRWRQVVEGTASESLPPLEVVMWLGDAITDFPDLDQWLVDKPEAAFGRFGIEYFVMPNPMYGGWEQVEEE
ncbi:MAG: hypothetical protein GY719_40665 [bacterium]|nr:hypothetical protein [bacterium]